MARLFQKLANAWLHLLFATTLLASCSGLMADITGEGDIAKKSRVVSFDSEADALRAFNGASVQQLPQGRGQSRFHITFPSRPDALDVVEPGWVIVAGLGGEAPPDRQMSENDAIRLLKERGLLAKVTAEHTTDSGSWVVSLQPAALEDVIEDGTVHLRISKTIESRNRDSFAPSDSPHQESFVPPQGSFVRVATHGQASQECGQRQIQQPESRRIDFDGVPLTASFDFQTKLTLNHTLEFADGRLEEATFYGSLCYEGEIGVRSEMGFPRIQEKLWHRVSRPRLVWIGWLPIVVHAKTTLDYQASARAELVAEPLVHGHSTIARGVVYPSFDDQSDNLRQYDSFSLNFGEYADTANVSVALVSKLEAILYGIAGPYLDGTTSVGGNWDSATDRPESEFGLSAGLGLGLAMEPILFDYASGNEPLISYQCSWDGSSNTFTPSCNSTLGFTSYRGIEIPTRSKYPHTLRRSESLSTQRTGQSPSAVFLPSSRLQSMSGEYTSSN